MTSRPVAKIHNKFAEDTATIKVTQLEAAVRQLVQAIKFYFYDGDAVSIHSLTRNAEEILSKLLIDKGKKSMWTATVDMVKEERREEFRRKIDGAKNAFKHRVVSETNVIEMPLEVNELFLLFSTHAVHSFWLEEFKKHPELILFECWYITHHPDILDGLTPQSQLIQATCAGFRHSEVSKQEYFSGLYDAAIATISKL